MGAPGNGGAGAGAGGEVWSVGGKKGGGGTDLQARTHAMQGTAAAPRSLTPSPVVAGDGVRRGGRALLGRPVAASAIFPATPAGEGSCSESLTGRTSSPQTCACACACACVCACACACACVARQDRKLDVHACPAGGSASLSKPRSPRP